MKPLEKRMKLPHANKERGQAFVELALSLTFLLVLMAVAIDLGWVLFTMVAMRDSVQEAAAFASQCQNTQMIVSRMKDSATAPLNIDDIQDFKIEYFDASGNANGLVSYGYTVRATLTVEHKILVPFVGAFIGNKGSIPLTVHATDTIMQLDTVCNP